MHKAPVYLIAILAIMTGVFDIVAAIDWHGEVNGAYWIGIGGALSILFGGIVAILPGAGALAILWLIGLYPTVVGLTRLVAGLPHSRIPEHRQSRGRGAPAGDLVDRELEVIGGDHGTV